MTSLNIIKEIEEITSIVILIPGVQYPRVTLDIARQLSGERVCYVTLNKTFRSIDALFFKNNIRARNFFFIDAISKSFTESAPEEDRCQLITPGSLTEMSLVINEVLKAGFDYLIFDSVTNLLVYQKQTDVLRFITDLVNKTKQTQTKMIMYAVQEEEALLRKICVAVDKCITAEGTSI